MLLELPDALRESIFGFLSVHSPDHLSLACTCTQLLQQVETFSKKEIGRITREHNVDDDWLYRAGMQAGATGPQEDWSYIHLPVSQRRLLRAAYRTRTYSFGTDPPLALWKVDDLAMHPDGERLLIGGMSKTAGEWNTTPDVRLWDVEAKHCTRIFEGHFGEYADAVYFSDGCAISQSYIESTLFTWNLSDGTRRDPTEVSVVEGKHALSNEEMFVPNRGVPGGNGVINAINIHTGVIRSSPPQAWYTGNMCGVEVHLCGDFLLAAALFEEGGAGIYIFDRSSLELMTHIAGKYACIKSTANGDVVAEKVEDGSFDVFQLNDDRLVFRTSFQRRPSQNNRRNGNDPLSDYASILLVHNTKAYVRSYREGPASCIEVYNILTGDLERRFWYPNQNLAGATCLVAGKKELFCGVESSGISVYLLE
jgi:hypothetical protein